MRSTQIIADPSHGKAESEGSTYSAVSPVHFKVADGFRLAAIRDPFAGLFFPNPVGAAGDELLLGVAAVLRDRPVGLILARTLVPDRLCHVLSWCVAPGFWGRGIGSGLLQTLAQAARKRGLQRLQVGFRTDWQSAAKVRHILAARGWCEPVEVLRLFKIDQAGFIEPAWFGRIRLPAGYEIFDWSQLTPAERELIEQRQRQQNWCPASLSPFQDPRRLEPLNSLGLRYRGQVVGWQITHRLAPDLIRYSALFVSPELQRLGRGISLFVNALQRQFAAGIPKALFQILTENVRAVRFVERHLVTCITAQDGYLLSFKEIDQ